MSSQACKLPQAEKVLEVLPESRFHYLHQPETEIQAEADPKRQHVSWIFHHQRPQQPRPQINFNLKTKTAIRILKLEVDLDQIQDDAPHEC